MPKMSPLRALRAAPFLALLPLASGLLACGSATDTRTLTVRLSHTVDTQALVFDDLRYTNAAGNPYSVERLEYFVGSVLLHRADGSTLRFPGAHYCNARDGVVNEFRLENVPTGAYTGVSLLIGLDATQNVTGALPATIQNTNMAWPVPMGGGYHLLKLEGHFRDGAGVTNGFAMHVGRTENAVTAHADAAFAVGVPAPVLGLQMNVNEWFRGPANYDFAADPVYSMSSDTAMHKLSANGADVFTIVTPAL